MKNYHFHEIKFEGNHWFITKTDLQNKSRIFLTLEAYSSGKLKNDPAGGSVVKLWIAPIGRWEAVSHQEAGEKQMCMTWDWEMKIINWRVNIKIFPRMIIPISLIVFTGNWIFIRKVAHDFEVHNHTIILSYSSYHSCFLSPEHFSHWQWLAPSIPFHLKSHLQFIWLV